MPSEAEEYRKEGNTLFARGEWAAASACYERALNADGCTAIANVAHSNLSLCLFKLGRFGEALCEAEQAVAVQPQWPKGWCRKAAALEALGRTQDALVAARQALTLEPGSAELRSLALSLKKKLGADDPAPKDGAGGPSCRKRDGPPAPSWSALRHDPPQGKGDNLLVLLHGLGDTPQRYLDFGIRLQLPSTSVVALRAPAPLGAGGPLEGQVDGFQWYPAFEDDGELIKASRTERRRLEGMRRSADLVSEMLQHLWDEEGWSRQTTFLLGFSQGGVVAVEVGCRQTLAGVVAVSGSLLEEALHDRGTGTGCGSDANGQVEGKSGWRCSGETPMLLSHGTRDEKLSIEVARRCSDRLKQSLGADLVTWREYDKAHEMLAKPPEVHDLMAFMAKHLTIRGPLPGEQGNRVRGGLFANREDLVEIRDPSVIRSVLLGEAGRGDLHVYQD